MAMSTSRKAKNRRAKAIACPDVLEGKEREAWDRIVPFLYDAGVYEPLYQGMMVVYCKTLVSWKRVSKQLEQEGEWLTTAQGKRQRSPLVEIERQYFETIKRILHEFGLWVVVVRRAERRPE